MATILGNSIETTIINAKRTKLCRIKFNQNPKFKQWNINPNQNYKASKLNQKMKKQKLFLLNHASNSNLNLLFPFKALRNCKMQKEKIINKKRKRKDLGLIKDVKRTLSQKMK